MLFYQKQQFNLPNPPLQQRNEERTGKKDLVRNFSMKTWIRSSKFNLKKSKSS